MREAISRYQHRSLMRILGSHQRITPTTYQAFAALKEIASLLEAELTQLACIVEIDRFRSNFLLIETKHNDDA